MKTGDQFWIEFGWQPRARHGDERQPASWPCVNCEHVTRDIDIIQDEHNRFMLPFPEVLTCGECGLEMVAAKNDSHEGRDDYYDIAEGTYRAWPYTVRRLGSARPTRAQLLFEEELEPGDVVEVDPGVFNFKRVIESLWTGGPEKDWEDIEKARGERRALNERANPVGVVTDMDWITDDCDGQLYRRLPRSFPIRTELEIKNRARFEFHGFDHDEAIRNLELPERRGTLQYTVDFSAEITEILDITLSDGTILSGHPQGVGLDGPPGGGPFEPAYPGLHITQVSVQQGEQLNLFGLGDAGSPCRSARLTENGLEFS